MSESKNREELRKLLGAMNKDEQDELLTRMEALQSYANIPIHIVIHNPADPAMNTDVRGRPLKDHEIISYLTKLRNIREELLTAKNPDEVPLLPDDLSKLHDLFDEYITLSTGIPREFLKSLGDSRTRYQLFRGIMQASQPSGRDLEQAQKFRGNQ